MHGTSKMLALASSITSAMAAVQGFNYGSTFTTGAAKEQADFESEFKIAQALSGAPGTFNSARLYTMVQGGTTNDPISAIPAALNTDTTLLLGLWASAGDATFANELQALKTAVSTYADSFSSLVVGISVGSEDIYRESPTGQANGDDPGASPDTIVDYIGQVKDVLTAAGISVPVGHVDTWNAWSNSSVTSVIEACDFIGIDTYPYYQNTETNGIDDAKYLFDKAVAVTAAAAGSKPIWVTETGWPVSGPTENLAIPSTSNAKTFWDEIGCNELFGVTNVWWYTLRDADPGTPSPSFGIIGSSSTTPLYDLSCSNVSSSSSSSAVSATSSAAAGGSSTTLSVAVSQSSAASAAAGSATSVAVGGSPALSSGLPSSQLSLEAQTSTAAATGSAATGTGSGSGSGSGAGTGSNSTVAATATPTPSLTTASTGAGNAVSLGAAFVALMAAMLAL